MSPDKRPFVHLHLHSEYSILDGMCRLDRLLEEVHHQGMPSVAITDHGNMFGVLDFYTKAKKAGVHPIIGCEMYVTPGSRFDRTPTQAGGTNKYHHLTLLCKNQTGYTNLMQLCSAGYLEGFYHKPRIDREILSEHCEGLIALSGCLAGEASRYLLKDDVEKSREVLEWYAKLMGEENFYVEIMSNSLPEQTKVNEGLVQLAREIGLPLVATNDAHYIHRSDAEAHRAMVCIQTGSLMNDPSAMHFDTDDFYLKTPQEMWEELGDYPEALKNTNEIALKCSVEIPGSGDTLLMPQFEPPGGGSTFGFLRDLAYQGAWERYYPYANQADWQPGDDMKTFTPVGTPPDSPGDWEVVAACLPKIVRERLDYELDVLKTKGFVGYFLIVWDFIRFARDQKIMVGPGRGSVVGSLVAYCLKITDLCPLVNGLIFERFQNLERTSPPDIDTDFSDKRRDEIIRYCAERYGSDCVAQIATFSRMKAKQVVRDVARVMGMPASEGNRIAKAIPNELKITLPEALQKEAALEAIRTQDTAHEKLFQIALTIEGTIRQTSVHAAGIVIGPESLLKLCPLKNTNEGETCTQFEHKYLEYLGLVKMDFLGLKTLSVIEDTVNAIRKKGVDFDIERIRLDDPATFELLQKGRTNGVFQLESAGMKDLIKRLHPERFADVVPLVALYRPGPLNSGMVDKFISRKHGNELVEYDHADLEPILAETYGTILYQEQVMMIAHHIAGYTLGEADVLRAAMGKKKVDLLAAEKKKFISGATGKGYSEEMAAKLFDTIEFFAGYGFNKSHSAAYGAIAYQTAYLKANYPAEFMAANMTNDRNNTVKVVKYVNDCQEMNIPVLPPDINQSDENFTATPIGIRFGLAGIKGIGEAAVRAMIEEREANGEFVSLSDFCLRIGTSLINTKSLECLIRCGAMDSFGKRRSQLLAVLAEVIETASTTQQDRAIGQSNLFEVMDVEINNEPNYPDIQELSDTEILNGEKDLLGYYVTGHPLGQYEKEMDLLATHKASDLLEFDNDQTATVRMVGIITNVRKRTTATKKVMAEITLEDLTGEFVATVFPNLYETMGDQLHEGKFMVVEGQAKIGREKPEVTVNQLVDFEQAWANAVESVHVNILSEGLEKKLLNDLKIALRRYPGKAQLVFHLKTPRHGEIVIKTGERYRIAPSQDVIHTIENFLEEDVVRFYVPPYKPPERRQRFNGSGRFQRGGNSSAA